jgi:hypothetical protein
LKRRRDGLESVYPERAYRRPFSQRRKEPPAYEQPGGSRLALRGCADLRNLPHVLVRSQFKRGQSRYAHRSLRFVEVPSLDVGRDDERNGIVADELNETWLHAGHAASPYAVAAV